MMNPFAFSAPKQLRGVSRSLTAILGLLFALVSLPAFGQVNVVTQHNDNTRSGLNANETVLTPGNVNASTFGIIATLPVDGLVAAQPLFVSNVNIPGQGLRNIVYVVTLHDSVYAFDADTANGGSPLWQVNFLNPAAGITSEPAVDLGCTSTTAFQEMGILGTPTIDVASQTIYVVAKTKENGSYHFRIHSLDLATGMEKAGGPVDINATVTGKLGMLLLNGSAKNMLARPGLLLSQGIVYVAFGSNGCDGQNTRGWIVAYDATTLLQLGVYNDTPDTTAARGNIWQSGSGLASDDAGNIFFSTANGGFDANTGGNDYGSSIMRIGWNGNGVLAARDYFTPYNVNYLNSTDLDVGSAGVLMLPDQPGAHPHLLVGSGKEGSVYVLDRDNMGQFNPTDNSQIVQFIPFDGNVVPPTSHTPPGSQVGRMFSTPAYWNNFVYLTGQNQGLTQFSMQNGQMVLLNRNNSTMCCAHTPSISANGNSNGVLWIPNGNGFVAFDASDASLPALYNNSKMGVLAHFNTPTIANGKVFVGANLNLQILGLLTNLTPTGGSNQAAPGLTALPIPLQVTATNPYSGLPVAGASVTFKDAPGGGTFSPNPVITDASGHASTTYTTSKTGGTYTPTASYASSTVAKFSVTVVGATPNHIAVVSGSRQTGPLQTTLAAPFVVQLDDALGNGVPGGTIVFSDGGKGGLFSANNIVTDAKGRAQTFYTSGIIGGAITISAMSGSIRQTLPITILAGAPTGISLVSGNFQKALAGATLPAKLIAKVVDQYNNGVAGVPVAFNDGGVSGTFASANVTTDSLGRAIATYTLPTTPQVVHVTATMSGVGTVTFTETAQ